MQLLRRPISASDQIPDRFYVISMEFLSLSRRRSSSRNVPGGEERGENKKKNTDTFWVFVHAKRFEDLLFESSSMQSGLKICELLRAANEWIVRFSLSQTVAVVVF